jgi:hypothetical protein
MEGSRGDPKGPAGRLLRALRVVATAGVSALVLDAHRLLGDRVSSNNDLRVHYRWAVEFVTALHGGDPYPRWMPLANQGLGEPALLFYAPLYYYATALVAWFTRDTWTAMKLVEFVGIWATGLFAYAALRRFCPPGWSLAGAVVVQAAPMIFMLFHFFNGLPWALSFTAAMAAVAFSLRPNPRRFVDAPLAVALAVVVSTHTLSGLMVLICLPFVNVRHLVGPASSAGRLRPVVAWGLSALVGIGLTMAYLFPALRARSLIMSEAWTTEYTYYNAFIFSTVTYFLYGMRWMTFQWPLPLVLLGSTIAITWYLVKTRERRDGSWAALTGLATVAWVSLFLCSELSYPLWALPSPLKLVQYPHRFLYVTTAVGLVANVACLRRVWSENYPRRAVLLVALPLVVSVLMTGAMYAKFTMLDARPSGLVGNTVGPHRGLPEYATRTVGPDWERYVQDGGLESECAARQAQCREMSPTGRTRRWRIDVPRAMPLRLPVFAFPAWSLGLDGQPLASTIDQATGLIAIELPAGRHEVSLTWAGLPSERTGLVLSGVSLALLLGLMAVERSTRAEDISRT